MPRIGLLQRSLHLADRGSTTFDPVIERVLITDRRWFKTTTTGSVITTTDTFGATGSASLAGTVLTKATDADGAWNNYATAAGLGGEGGLRFHTSSADWTQPQLNPTILWTLKTAAAVDNVRMWIGYSVGSGADAMQSTSSSPYDNTIAFRFDTSVPDTNWQAVTRGTANTVTDTGVVVAINTVYLLEFTASATEVVFRINNAVVATNTTNLPAASSDMFGEMRLRNLSAASRAIKFTQATGVSD